MPKCSDSYKIDLLSAEQVSAVVGLFNAMLDPVDRAIANAPVEDEEISEEENRAVVASKAWLAEHPGEYTTLEKMMAEYGLSADASEQQERSRERREESNLYPLCARRCVPH